MNNFDKARFRGLKRIVFPIRLKNYKLDTASNKVDVTTVQLCEMNPLVRCGSDRETQTRQALGL